MRRANHSSNGVTRFRGTTHQSPALRAICLLIAVASAAVFLLSNTDRAQAHARLVAASPAPGSALGTAPPEFRLRFNEPVDAQFSRADLVGRDGTPVPTAPIATDPADQKTVVIELPNPQGIASGTYVLVWRVLSAADGHATSGTLPFSVGTGQLPTQIASLETSGRPPWWRVTARWLELASLLAVVGGYAFGTIVVRSIWTTTLGDLLMRWWRRLWWSSAACLAVGLLLTLFDQGLIATGASILDPPALSIYRRVIFDSTFGTAWLLRLIASLSLVVISYLIERGRGTRTWLWPVGLLVGGLMLLTVPVAGHATAERQRALAIATDWFHLAAGAVWLGVLGYLAASVAALRRESVAEAAATAARLVARFSTAALAAVGLLLVTGVGNAALHVSGPGTLRQQDYGVVLIAKSILVALVLIAAAVNLLVNRPRLKELVRLGDMFRIRRQLRTTELVVAFELALGVAIIAAAAALTELAPADVPLAVEVAAKQVIVDERGTAGDLKVWLLGRLNGDPDDRFTISVTSPSGETTEIQRLIVETSIRQRPGDETPVGDRFDAVALAGNPGSFQFPAVRLGLQGIWSTTLIVRRAGLEDVRVTFPVDTREAGVRPPRAVSDRWRWPRVTPAAWALFALAAIVAIGGVIGTRRLPGLEPLAAALILTMVALIAAGFAVSAVRQTIPVTVNTDLINPLLADTGSVTRGATIYAANCLACHGPAGAGVESPDPEHGHGAAADLTDKRTQDQRDGDLYYAISNGIPGSVMPAYDQALTDEERWDVVNYLRQLQHQSNP